MAARLQSRGAVAALWVLGLAGALGALIWPVVAVSAAAGALLIAIALRAPALGLVGALLLAGGEGLLKARLNAEGVPSATALGALLLDLALLLAAAWLLLASGPRPLVAVWRGGGRAEHVAWCVVAAWLAISVVQAVFSPDIVNAVEGLRLTQSYALLVLAGIAVYAVHPSELALTRALLAAFAVLAAFAALRAFLEPSAWELAYLLDRSEHARLGDVVRDVGSFSTAVALAGFLVPVAVFSLIIGFLDARVRLLALGTVALAAIGIVDSYVRVAVLGLGAGTAVLAALLMAGSGVPRRTRVIAIALVLAVSAGGFVAALAVSGGSSVTERRAQGLSDPFSDASVESRRRTWENSAETIGANPLGTGIGTVGRATEVDGRQRFTDNSYLKILQEQGFPGFTFVLGMAGTVLLLGRRLARDGPARRPPAIAALGAVVSFLTLCLFQEYVESAGKVVAWTLLGVALWFAYGAPGPRAPRDDGEDDGLRAA